MNCSCGDEITVKPFGSNKSLGVSLPISAYLIVALQYSWRAGAGISWRWMGKDGSERAGRQQTPLLTSSLRGACAIFMGQSITNVYVLVLFVKPYLEPSLNCNSFASIETNRAGEVEVKVDPALSKSFAFLSRPRDSHLAPSISRTIDSFITLSVKTKCADTIAVIK